MIIGSVNETPPFVIKVEFAGKGAQVAITHEQFRDAEGRFRAFEECVKAVMFQHGIMAK